jgi:hypothetical protein
LEINTQTKIDKSLIDYINSLTITGMTLKAILKLELDHLSEKELENKRKNFQKKLSKKGYKFDNQLKMYVLKPQVDTSTSDLVEPQVDTPTSDLVEPQVDTPTSDLVEPQVDTSTSDLVEPQVDTSTSDLVEPQVDTSTSDLVEPQVDTSTSDLVEPQVDTSTRQKKLTKKQKKELKEIEEKLKQNPLYFHVKPYQILENIDSIYKQRESDSDQICMMMYPSLLKEFKKIEQRFGYINAYYVQNCAIVSCYDITEDLKNSDLLLQYLDFISKNCHTEKKKQFTMRTTRYINRVVKSELEKTFPILNKGDVIGFCFFAFLKCYEKSIGKQ